MKRIIFFGLIVCLAPSQINANSSNLLRRITRSPYTPSIALAICFWLHEWETEQKDLRTAAEIAELNTRIDELQRKNIHLKTQVEKLEDKTYILEDKVHIRETQIEELNGQSPLEKIGEEVANFAKEKFVRGMSSDLAKPSLDSI